MSAPLDGKSFAGQIRTPESSHAQPVYAEYNLRTPRAKYMLRDGKYKYTFWTHDIAELYDLEADPQEMNNLASEPAHARTAAGMKDKLFGWYRPPEI